MRGIILEKTNDGMVVLDETGQFRKLSNTEDRDIGMEISFKIPSKIKKSLRLKLLTVATASILVMGIGVGTYSYTQPYSYVNIDINPSIEITANIYNRIISAQGFNAEGKEILIESQFRHKAIEQGVSKIIETATDMGYIAQTRDNAVLLTVFSGDENYSEKLEDRIIDTVTNNVQEKTSDVEVEILVEKAEITEHVVEEGVNISPGKKLFVEKVLKEEPETDIEDLSSASVGEIMRSIKDKEDKDNIENNKNGREPNGLAHGYYTLGNSNRGNRENIDLEEEEKGKNNNTNIDNKRTAGTEKTDREYSKDEDKGMPKENKKKPDNRDNNINSEKGKDKKPEENNKQDNDDKEEKDKKEKDKKEKDKKEKDKKEKDKKEKDKKEKDKKEKDNKSNKQDKSNGQDKGKVK